MKRWTLYTAGGVLLAGVGTILGAGGPTQNFSERRNLETTVEASLAVPSADFSTSETGKRAILVSQEQEPVVEEKPDPFAEEEILTVYISPEMANSIDFSFRSFLTNPDLDTVSSVLEGLLDDAEIGDALKDVVGSSSMRTYSPEIALVEESTGRSYTIGITKLNGKDYTSFDFTLGSDMDQLPEDGFLSYNILSMELIRDKSGSLTVNATPQIDFLSSYEDTDPLILEDNLSMRLSSPMPLFYRTQFSRDNDSFFSVTHDPRYLDVITSTSGGFAFISCSEEDAIKDGREVFSVPSLNGSYSQTTLDLEKSLFTVN